ncbi:MAG: hypothetical protein KTV77_01330 [Wolbachia endosymbiont of Fragariocoptes setiger]|nr:hypothetical protein [Wolbachia endosymbiont of Fragariocoptes setiger]
MVKIKSNLKKKLKQKLVLLFTSLIILLVLYFFIKNTGDTTSQIRIKLINIGDKNEK